KSWLSHPGVDRRSQLLPPAADPETPRISPLDAAARILGQIREGWEAAHAQEGVSLADQAVTLTVPASFDAAARDLTVQAAAQAGLAKLTLLEEPQAALYAWVEAAGDEWRKHVRPGDVILVVDVGGGTSDFSLISVGEDEGRLALTRLAVGDHILLGGDNVDLALAHVVSEKLRSQGTKLDSWQFAALAHACRDGKETWTSSLSIPGRGSGLVGGTIRAEITKEELRRTVDAFFPDVDVAAAPATQRRTGLTTLGLPYAPDPAVTRHLAAFLRRGSGTLARRSPGSPRPFARSAWRRSGWRKAAPSTSRSWRSARWSARPLRSASSLPARAATTRPVPSSRRWTIWRSCRPSRRRSPPPTAARAKCCPSTCGRTSPRWERSSCTSSRRRDAPGSSSSP